MQNYNYSKKMKVVYRCGFKIVLIHYSFNLTNSFTYTDPTIASGALVVNTTDGVVLPHLYTRPQHTVQFLLHFGIAPLYCPKVKVTRVVTLHLDRGGCPASHPDPVHRAAHLHDVHP